ncbi:hypothetical protein WKI45_04370 [Delftia tsuruhatensis]
MNQLATKIRHPANEEITAHGIEYVKNCISHERIHSFSIANQSIGLAISHVSPHRMAPVQRQGLSFETKALRAAPAAASRPSRPESRLIQQGKP